MPYHSNDVSYLHSLRNRLIKEWPSIFGPFYPSPLPPLNARWCLFRLNKLSCSHPWEFTFLACSLSLGTCNYSMACLWNIKCSKLSRYKIVWIVKANLCSDSQLAVRKDATMNRILVVLAIFLRLCHSQEYVPGTPGADWTLQEVLAVKSKLQTVFGTNGGYRASILKLKH